MGLGVTAYGLGLSEVSPNAWSPTLVWRWKLRGVVLLVCMNSSTSTSNSNSTRNGIARIRNGVTTAAMAAGWGLLTETRRC